MKNGIRFLLGIVILLIIAIITSSCSVSKTLGSEEIEITTTKLMTTGSDETVVIGNNLVIRLSLDDLVQKAMMAVKGRVVKILPAKETYSETLKRNVIYTDVIIKPEQYLFGQPQADLMAVQVSGGRVGKTAMRDNDAPIFYLGEESVLFLERITNGSPPIDISSANCKLEFANGTLTDLDGNQSLMTDLEQKILSKQGTK
jgi:hypothetical protein